MQESDFKVDHSFQKAQIQETETTSSRENAARAGSRSSGLLGQILHYRVSDFSLLFLSFNAASNLSLRLPGCSKDRVPMYRRIYKDTLQRQKEELGIDYEDEQDEIVKKFRVMRRAKSGG